MKKNLFILLLCSTGLFAQKPIEIPLWPHGAPNGVNGKELELKKNRISNITPPPLTIYPAKKDNGKAILMCPEGGYSRLAMDNEGHDMASWFNSQGITFEVLKYRLPNEHSEVPLSDAEQAMRIIRTRANEWNTNPSMIGVMAASAGGHLASTLATNYSANDTRPDFQILLYPVISMEEQTTHSGSRKNLIGDATKGSEMERKYSNEKNVDSETPPAFIALSSDDKSVPPTNSIEYYMALLEHDVPVSMHIYPTGGHGWGFRDSLFIYKRQWTEELEKWLREL